jgi:hypothetical protein
MFYAGIQQKTRKCNKNVILCKKRDDSEGDFKGYLPKICIEI